MSAPAQQPAQQPDQQPAQQPAQQPDQQPAQQPDQQPAQQNIIHLPISLMQPGTPQIVEQPCYYLVKIPSHHCL